MLIMSSQRIFQHNNINALQEYGVNCIGIIDNACFLTKAYHFAVCYAQT